MFGENYKVEEFSNKVKLDDGNYKAKIVKTDGIETPSGNKYILIEFVVNGNPNAWPNNFHMFDSPTEARGKMTLEQLQSIWNKKTTAFFDSFGITRGDFDFRKWVGKEGEITVQAQYNNPEYSEIIPYKTKPRERKAMVDTFTNTFGGEVVASTPAVANTEFPQDMPF